MMADVPRPPQKQTPPDAAAERRRRAEEWLARPAAADDSLEATAAPAPEDPAAMLHELRVHHVELEMQNEELRRAQLEADTQRKNYFELFHLAPVGYLTVNREGIIGDANLIAAQSLGVERRLLIGRPLIVFIFTPDRKVYQEHQWRLERTEEPQACELRLQPIDAESFWAHLEWRPQHAPLRHHLTFTNVQDRVVAEEALRESEETLRATIDNSFDVIFSLSEEGVFLFVSAAWERHFGYPVSDALQQPFARFVHPDDVAPLVVYLERVLSAGRGETSPAYRVKHADGRWRWLVSNGAPYVDPKGVRRYLGVARDITAHRQAEEQVRKQNQELLRLNSDLAAEAAALAEANAIITRIAATDDLTGLANRRHFYATLETAVSTARRHGSPLALVILDLDGLAQVSDNAGPEDGDKVLTSFAALLAELCRAEDLPARLGGGRFSVVLPGIDLSGALGLAERVLTAVRACDALAQRCVTVSAGVAQWSPAELSDDLLRRADEAVYDAKRGGGDFAEVDD